MLIETSAATRNHPKVIALIRAIEAAPSMRAIPTTSVENTNGAMIILMSFRNPSVTSERPAAALSAAGPVPSSRCSSNPTSGPAIVARTTNEVRRGFMVYF